MTDDDSEIFRQAMKHVKPLAGVKRVRRPRQYRITQPQRDDDLIPLVDDKKAAPHSFQRTGLRRQQLKSLKKGLLPIQAELDLHHHNQQQAHIAFSVFINDCIKQQKRVVKIIHGKGLRSSQGPVLPELVRNWLLQLPNILAYCPAPANQGGHGVTFVLLAHHR